MVLSTSMKYDVAVAATIIIFVTYIARIIYSVYFGPLSKFPGPKLAAATLGYEFYYDIILKGRRGLGWTMEEVQVFLVDVRKDMRNKSIHSYWPLHVVYGQKPVEC